MTTRLPLGLLRTVTLALAGFLWLLWVGPLKLLTQVGAWRPRLADLPLAQYVQYPFRVLWNDQLDRFSAPLEKRYSRPQVEELIGAPGLVDVAVLLGYGWRAVGRRPEA